MLKYSWRLVLDIGSYWRKGVGRMLREAGLALDRKGSQLSHDIAYL